jgi:hypothetical protein
MQSARPATANRPLTVRSAVSNGTKMLKGVDARSATARRFRDLVDDFTRDLGGEDVLTVADRTLIRQAAAITLQVEQLQAAIIRGEPVDEDKLIRLSGTARRCLAGIRKRERPAPRLADYLATRGAA